MNFPPIVKSWMMLIALVLSSGISVGYAAFLSGASVIGSVICGLGTAATNVYHNLAASPRDKADRAESAAPFPISPPPKP